MLAASALEKAGGHEPARVYDAFARTAERYPEHDFLCVLPETAERYGIAPVSISYHQALQQVDRLQQRYRECGVTAGQRVGLLLENRPAMFLHWFALNALDVSVVPINAEWRPAELEYLIGHAEIVLAVAPEARFEDFRQAAMAAGRALPVATADLEGLRAGSVRTQRLEPEAADALQRECALLYTSGTTGKPKGCVLSNDYFLTAGRWYLEIGGLCEVRAGEERLLTPLPMSHMNAMACSTLAMVLSGGCVIPVDRFHPRSWWDSVRAARATIIHYLGVMPAMLLGAAPSAQDRQHAVRFGFGAGVSARLHAPFEERFGFPLLEAWAMTETGCAAAIIANREPRKVGTACFGRPSPQIDYRIVDESGADVEIGTHGELLVRVHGPLPAKGFFTAYLKDPEATTAAWDGGWFHTGDVVYADADGHLHFVDRRKNVIRRSGENISAVEVEGVLLQHPAVASVGVSAVPDEVRGDEVMACVVPRGGRHLGTAALAQEIQAFCLARLAYFKAPGYVCFCEGLPLTPTEKIQRARLRELACNLLGSECSIDLRSHKKRPGP
ncbi:MAG: AMP-binding protein, partial [Sinobacteraceae bacterium]|nr:AMP-binding protein [Nevskiaceae bacterium]